MKRRCTRTGYLSAILLALFIAGTSFQAQLAYAISANDLHSILNDTPFYDPNDTACSANATTTLVGNDNERKALNYFVGKGLTPEQAAGIVGNLMIESQMDPGVIEGGTDGTTMTPGKGYGIAQWTTAQRQGGLSQLAAKENLPINDLGLQLDYVWQEFTGPYQTVLAQLKASTAVEGVNGSAVIVMIGYEAPKDHDPTGPNATARTNAALQALRDFDPTAAGQATGTTITTNSCGGGGGAGCAGGNGAGKFSDNSAISFPNIQKMCQRAKEMADPTSALFTYWWMHGFPTDTNNPNSLGICATIGPGNIVPGSNGVICNAGWCAFTAAFIWGYTHAGYDFASHNDDIPQTAFTVPEFDKNGNIIHVSATYEWNDLLKQGIGHKDDRNPPIGAFLFYDNSTTTPPTGHVVVYLGHNTIITTDMDSSGHTKPGFVGIVPAKDMEDGPWRLHYLGWAEPKLSTPQIFPGQP